jgi:hypothetical protein
MPATATAMKLPDEVNSAEPALMDTGSDRSEMGLLPMSGSDASLTERALDEIHPHHDGLGCGR